MIKVLKTNKEFFEKWIEKSIFRWAKPLILNSNQNFDLNFDFTPLYFENGVDSAYISHKFGISIYYFDTNKYSLSIVVRNNVKFIINIYPKEYFEFENDLEFSVIQNESETKKFDVKWLDKIYYIFPLVTYSSLYNSYNVKYLLSNNKKTIKLEQIYFMICEITKHKNEKYFSMRIKDTDNIINKNIALCLKNMVYIPNNYTEIVIIYNCNKKTIAMLSNCAIVLLDASSGDVSIDEL